MKKFTILLFALFIGFAVNGLGQTTLDTQSFETNLDGYSHTPSQIPADDPGDQYFHRAEPSDPAIYEGSVGPYTNVTGDWLFVGSNPNTINGGSPGEVDLDPITVTGYSSLEFHADFGACPLDWDTGDDLRVDYNFDGGAWATLFYFEATGDGTNEPLELLGNATGGINTANGTLLTYDLTTISSNNFSGSGTILNIRIVCDAGANYEAFGVDNISVVGTAGGNNSPFITNVIQNPIIDITSSTTVSVSADVTDADGTVSLVELHWGTTSGSLTNTISMPFVSGDTYTTLTNIPGQFDETTVFYEVYAEDDLGDWTTSAEEDYLVFDPKFATLPYLQEFDPDFGNMYTRSQIGDQIWGITNFGNPAPCAIMSGFSGVPLDNEDWMITPSFDFTGITNNIILSFEEAINYESSVVDNEKVFISTNYSGIGDPSIATWIELIMPTRSPGNSWSFFPTGDLDISSYIGNSNVHIAFKYLSTTAGAGTWEVDNVSISEVSPILTADFTGVPISVYEGSTVSFTSSVTGGFPPYIYSWDLDGDGFEDSTDPNPSFPYPTAGLYTVELTVTDDALDTDTETKVDYIEVLVNPFGSLVINEVDVDTPGTDALEFIELYDGGTGNTAFGGLVVVLYNGNGDASYNAFDLEGFSTDANGYFLLGNAGVIPTPSIIFSSNTLQNGADAIALYAGAATDFPNGTAVTTTNLIDAIVYDTDDGDDSGLLVLLNTGQPQVNEGGRGDKDNHSNQRIPNGSGGQRNTDTYDQSLPTPGAENVSVFTDWTGDIDNDWNDAGNWTNGVPTTLLDASIPDVGANPYPVVTGSANANNIFVASAAQLTIAPAADLTAEGQVDIDGNFFMSSNASGVSASFIEQGGTTGGGTFHFDRDLFCTGSNPTNEADPFGWHYLSAPIDGLSTDDLPDYFVNQWDEVGNSWMNYEGTEGCVPYPTEYLDDVETWSINLDTEYNCPTPGTGTVVEYTGAFWAVHSGSYSTPITASGGSFNGWNMIGNPYSSAIDPAAFDWTGFDNGTYGVALYDGCAGNYKYSNLGNSYQYKVGPTQGFFMLTSGATTFALDGSERVHDNGTTIYKDAVSDLLTIEAKGDGTSDLAYIRFMEGSQAGMDVADFPKMFSSTEGLAQIYTTAQGEDLAVNALPATPIVPMGFTSVTSGEYTISAIETSEFTNVVLEDRFTWQQTDLLTDSYTFNYSVNDDANRFFIHFTPLGIGDNLANSINIWSENHNIHIQAPDVRGDIVVFNMMGQEITRTNIEAGLNVVPVTDVNAFYVVKIVGSEVSKTGKVYVK